MKSIPEPTFQYRPIVRVQKSVTYNTSPIQLSNDQDRVRLLRDITRYSCTQYCVGEIKPLMGICVTNDISADDHTRLMQHMPSGEDDWIYELFPRHLLLFKNNGLNILFVCNVENVACVNVQCCEQIQLRVHASFNLTERERNPVFAHLIRAVE